MTQTLTITRGQFFSEGNCPDTKNYSGEFTNVAAVLGKQDMRVVTLECLDELLDEYLGLYDLLSTVLGKQGKAIRVFEGS